MVTWNLNEQTPTGDSITYKEDNTILEINNILNTQHAGFYKCIGSHPTLSETIQFSEIYVRVRDEGKHWGILMFNRFRIYHSCKICSYVFTRFITKDHIIILPIFLCMSNFNPLLELQY